MERRKLFSKTESERFYQRGGGSLKKDRMRQMIEQTISQT